MSQEQIRYRLMQKKFEEHQALMARVEERKQRLEQERLAASINADVRNENQVGEREDDRDAGDNEK